MGREWKFIISAIAWMFIVTIGCIRWGGARSRYDTGVGKFIETVALYGVKK
jgi:hypothetical protein